MGLALSSEVVSPIRKKKCTIAALSSLHSQKFIAQSQQEIYGNHKVYCLCVWNHMEDVTRTYREVHSEATLLFFPLIFLGRDGLGSR